MLVTPHFVFIHIPKTAGRFCRQQIVNYGGPVLYRGGLHEPLVRLPQPFRHLPTIAFVRNPWDWYVSWYYHMHSFGGFNPLFASAIRAGHLEFTPVMQHVFDSIEPGTRAAAELDDYLHSPEHAARNSHDLDTAMIAYQREHNCGMLTWRFCFNLGVQAPTPCHVGRFETLADDLIGAMTACGSPLSEQSSARIRASRPLGEGEKRAKRDYHSLYTDRRLIERVAEKERLVIAQFGYNFG
jgi:hypothetical protein